MRTKQHEGVATYTIVHTISMLSKEEALHFVTEVLGISAPLEKIAQDPHHLLKELMPAFQMKIPFQSVTLIAIEPNLRHRYVHDNKVGG